MHHPLSLTCTFAVFFALTTAQPLTHRNDNLYSRTLTKRTTSTAATVVIVLAILFVVIMSSIFCCCMCTSDEVKDPEPEPRELANELGVLRARVQQLEDEERARLRSGDRPPSPGPTLASLPPVYTAIPDEP
ncbi:hypothetical protein C8F04DRAFT_1147381 [Mycena alexandri]|uniref:Uncharacterized protein n=1 Tax=Mycena alexandri TaxID=1745969 RepID=A0AAD6S5U0_9AGAR|nr:hypothetical protein C8F04DRAFT_1147381 [Mycena alexandri]